jgi:hypothetical protein
MLSPTKNKGRHGESNPDMEGHNLRDYHCTISGTPLRIILRRPKYMKGSKDALIEIFANKVYFHRKGKEINLL